LLDALEQAGQPTLEQSWRHFLLPPFAFGADPNGGQTFVRLIGRLFSEEISLFSHVIKNLRRRFGTFPSRASAAAPELPTSEVMWRMLFMGGALGHALRSCGQDLEVLHGGLCDTSMSEGALRRLIGFAAQASARTVPAGVTHV
jgi:hypothetical protein